MFIKISFLRIKLPWHKSLPWLSEGMHADDLFRAQNRTAKLLLMPCFAFYSNRCISNSILFLFKYLPMILSFWVTQSKGNLWTKHKRSSNISWWMDGDSKFNICISIRHQIFVCLRFDLRIPFEVWKGSIKRSTMNEFPILNAGRRNEEIQWLCHRDKSVLWLMIRNMRSFKIWFFVSYLRK